MTREELRRLVEEVRQRQSELDNVEVKSARGGTPKRLFESFSAFANSGGGVLLFGLDEEGDFSVTGVGDEPTSLAVALGELPGHLALPAEAACDYCDKGPICGRAWQGLS